MIAPHGIWDWNPIAFTCNCGDRFTNGPSLLNHIDTAKRRNARKPTDAARTIERLVAQRYGLSLKDIEGTGAGLLRDFRDATGLDLHV